MRVRTGQRGFTLAEVACAVGISAVVAGMITVGGMHAKKSSDLRRAQADVAKIEIAIHTFEAKRGSLPKDSDRDGLTQVGEILDQLKSWGLLEQEFSAVDPWGGAYVIVLRRDYGLSYDTARDYHYYPFNDSPDGFQVYSKGPDGQAGAVSSDGFSIDDIGNFRL